MIKSELVLRIADQNPHLYVRDVERLVDAILDEIEAALARQDRAELRGFGVFTIRTRSARPGVIQKPEPGSVYRRPVILHSE